MRWDFAHFFFGAEVYGQINYALLQNSCQPLAPLINVSIAQPCFNANWQPSSFSGGDGGDRYVGSTNECGTTRFDGGFGGTTHVDIDTVKA